MKASILAKLDNLDERYQEVAALLSDSETISDQNRFRELSKEYAELEPVVKAYVDYRDVINKLQEAKLLLKDSDPDMRAMAQDELAEAESKMEPLELDLQRLLLPKDPNDEKNVFLEIRAGTGGDEAAIFSGDLFRMYSRFAEGDQAGSKVVKAIVPLSEMFGYVTSLRTLSSGRATSTMEFSHYAETPKNISEEVISATVG